MTKPQEQSDNTNQLLNAAQLRKVRLEIKDLKRSNKWGLVAIFIPLITTAIAVAGLVITIHQIQSAQTKEREERYRNETLMRQGQENDRVSKIHSQIRADKEQLLEFITNDKFSSVRAAFLIDDLNSQIEQLPKGSSEREAVTELLRRVAWRLPFDREEHFDFDVSALRRWKDYRQFWKLYLNSHHDFLISKYYPLLKQFHARDPQCIENLDYEEGTTTLTYKRAGTICDEKLINAFIYGYKEHLEVIKETNQLELVRKELEEFGRLTNNSAFAGKLTQHSGK